VPGGATSTAAGDEDARDRAALVPAATIVTDLFADQACPTDQWLPVPPWLPEPTYWACHQFQCTP
jgi:hypothetical protein